LIDHGEDAAVRGIDDQSSAVHVAQGVDGGLADDRIFAGGLIAFADVALKKGTGGEALVIMVNPTDRSAGQVRSGSRGRRSVDCGAVRRGGMRARNVRGAGGGCSSFV
jgi:hypothetical protein